MTEICGRCAAFAFDKNAEAALRDYVDNLDAEDKADEREYSRRLALCEQCGNLRNGLCALCGCFVLARAAKKAGRCPDVLRKW